MTRREFLDGTLALVALPGPSTPSTPPSSTTWPIPRRALGRTGETVSMIGLGGAHIGHQPSEAESIRLIRRAIDGGITFLDNCWDYHDGASEERMGKALRDGYRERAFLMTKIDGRDAKTATRQLEESLRRLRTERLDLLQLHEVIHADDPARLFAKGGAIETLVRAQQTDKTRFIGFTGHKSASLHLRMLELAKARGVRFDAVQLPLNVLDAHDDGFEKRVLPVLLKEEIGVLGMKPLGDGHILESGAATAEECLRYALSLPTSVVITGIDRQPILDQAFRIARRFEPLTKPERDALLARTSFAAKGGKWERYKTSTVFDGTTRHPEWMG